MVQLADALEHLSVAADCEVEHVGVFVYLPHEEDDSVDEGVQFGLFHSQGLHPHDGVHGVQQLLFILVVDVALEGRYQSEVLVDEAGAQPPGFAVGELALVLQCDQQVFEAGVLV